MTPDAASPARQVSAVLPIVMSLGALTVIAWQILRHGTAPQPDEGSAAHIWQLLMAGQVPVIAYFAIRRLPEAPRIGMWVLAVQIGAALAAAAPVFLLGW